MASPPHHTLPFCRGYTCLVSALLMRRHSRMRPGKGWRGFNFSRMSLAVLKAGFCRAAVRRFGPSVRTGFVVEVSPFTGSWSSRYSTCKILHGKHVCNGTVQACNCILLQLYLQYLCICTGNIFVMVLCRHVIV